MMLNSPDMKTKLSFLMMVCAWTLISSVSAQAGLLFTYSRLATKDLDQMNQLIIDKMKESRKESGDKVIPLREAMQAVYSRPNEDDMIEKIVSPLKTELEEHDAYEDAVRALVKEADGALNNPKAFKPEALNTYVVFLENIVAEFKPHVDGGFERSVLKTIHEAKISLTKEVVNERRLRMMRETESPSDTAGAILKGYEDAQAEAAKKAKEDGAKKREKDALRRQRGGR